MTVLKVPWVARAYVCALEISDEDFLEVSPISETPRPQVLEPCSYRVRKVHGQVLDYEVITILPSYLTCQEVVS
jgi:hypothetical protein